MTDVSAFRSRMSKPLIALGLLLSMHVSSVSAAVIPGQGDWTTTLQARDLNGNMADGPEAYYDTSLKITWLADANLAHTMGYRAAPLYPAGGPYLWSQASEWAANLNIYGISDWRLPQNDDSGPLGCQIRLSFGGECGSNLNPSSSEMAHMFFQTLGNSSYMTPLGTVNPAGGLTNTGPFSNVYSAYWSQSTIDSTYAWAFNMSFGEQGPLGRNSNLLGAWAVVNGDHGVPMVPEPSTQALMSLGIVGLMFLGARRRQGRSIS